MPSDAGPARPCGAARPGAVWVLADPRAGTAAQALGVAERLGVPFRTVPLAWGPLARLPWPWPTLSGLAPDARAAVAGGPAPALVISAGRRSAPVALALARRGARTVHCMRPGPGAGRFDRLVLGRHDLPGGVAPPANVLPVLGCTHRLSPAALAEARVAWSALAALPSPRVALLLGGPVRGEGLDPAVAAALAARVAAGAGSVLATTSRRTGAAAAAAVAAALAGILGRVFRWGDPGPNPYAGFLAWADAVVVTGDSVSMLSEALAGPAPVFVAAGAEGGRHALLHASLFAAGQARPLADFPTPFTRTALDESGQVAAALRRDGLIPGAT